ncbi:MAG: hypothetical protein A2091_09615 [Desulfuromonadales bacterium GWD2_61_12]|nr:MAG: hypothetical protein A2005_05435 [Desulfuromonadales bacterium GWC2_61_20]OGR36697.1 MAG: hypothetical protein A2091_09615 [Desulfuromonadales bacterium GWD2_61_12]HAD03772.1 hypothetical protein [Desulfuromonas sp.]HBT81886.1 hypothetical protein [Desulfuromonas sp.]
MINYIPGRVSAGAWFEQVVRILLCLLIAAMLIAMAVVIARTFVDVGAALHDLGDADALHHALRAILLDTLGAFVMVEVFRTAMAYFVEGRVKVTYIIDTVLVAVLTEVLAFWHRDLEITRLFMLLALISVLMLMRILAIRFSPNRRSLCDGL